MALLHNGVQINTIMPGFTGKPFSGHWASLQPCRQKSHLCRPGNALTQPIGYIIIWVQVHRVQGYDED